MHPVLPTCNDALHASHPCSVLKFQAACMLELAVGFLHIFLHLWIYLGNYRKNAIGDACHLHFPCLSFYLVTPYKSHHLWLIFKELKQCMMCSFHSEYSPAWEYHNTNSAVLAAFAHGTIFSLLTMQLFHYFIRIEMWSISFLLYPSI